MPSKREKLQGRGNKEVVVRRESRAKGEGDSERCNLPALRNKNGFGSIWAIVPEIWDSMGNIHLSQMIEDFYNLFLLC